MRQLAPCIPLLLATWLPGCVAPSSSDAHVATEPADLRVPRWPMAGSPLDRIIPPAPLVDRPIKVYLDPGHGAGRNFGNRGVRCQLEEAAMLELADDLADRLPGFGPIEVRSARPDGHRTSYPRRVAQADSWGADVFLSLHSDARGQSWPWDPLPGWGCSRNDRDPGFAILVSDRGSEQTVARRGRLADAVARRMSQAGFGPYVGGYGTLYDPGDVVGTWLDRRGLMMLRRPTMPSVIIETHHAYDLNEVRRWDEELTREAFARAVAHAVLETVGAPD